MELILEVVCFGNSSHLFGCRFDRVRTCVRFAGRKVEVRCFESFIHDLGCRFDREWACERFAERVSIRPCVYVSFASCSQYATFVVVCVDSIGLNHAILERGPPELSTSPA